MKRVFVEAFEDESRPQGGHAVIVVQGVEGLVDRPQFRLKPLDGAFVSRKGSGPRSNLLTPVTTRLTESGVELVVGPEIVENPLFLAGTPVVIEIPDAGARGEFLWPNVAPLAQPRRRTVVAKKPRASLGTAPTLPLPKAEDLGLGVLEGNDAPADDMAQPEPIVVKTGLDPIAPRPINAPDDTPAAGWNTAQTPNPRNPLQSPLPHARDPLASSEPINWQGRQAANRGLRQKWLVPVLALCALIGALSYYGVPGRYSGTGLSPANARDKSLPAPRAAAGKTAPVPPAASSAGLALPEPVDSGTDVAAIAPSNTNPAAPVCAKPDVMTDPLDGGRMRIRIAAECKGGEDVRLSYGGGTFVYTLDSNGGLDLVFDCFAGAAAQVEIRFADGRVRGVPVVATDFARISKVAILWKAPVNLDLHAFEYAAERGERGHVFEHVPGTASTALRETESARRGRGFMSASDNGRSAGDKVEVYTFFHSEGQPNGAVDLALDYETRGENPAAGTCGADANAEVPYRISMLVRGKQTLSEPGRIASAECGQSIAAVVRFNRANLPALKAKM